MVKKISPLDQAIENILFYIESNNLKGDNLLPSERYFSQNFNISRTTVRRALSKLIKQDKIYKEENKGYFVSPQKILRNVQDIYSTTKFFKSTNANLITKVLSINEILATKFLSRKLKLQLGMSISVLKRLRLLDGKPVILETSYIPTNYFSKLSNVNFEINSLYSSFEGIGLTIEKGIETIEVVPPTSDDQHILKVSPAQKIFITRGKAFLKNDEPIEYFNMKMVGKIIKFITKLT